MHAPRTSRRNQPKEWGIMRGIKTIVVAGVIAAGAVTGVTACSSGPPALSSACKAAVANEVAVVGGNNRAAAQLGVIQYGTPLEREDEAALAAVGKVCPPTVKVLMPSN